MNWWRYIQKRKHRQRTYDIKLYGTSSSVNIQMQFDTEKCYVLLELQDFAFEYIDLNIKPDWVKEIS